jgi:hypothetical protein
MPRAELFWRRYLAVSNLFAVRSSAIGPDRCCGNALFGSDRGDTGHVSDIFKPVLLTPTGHYLCIAAIGLSSADCAILSLRQENHADDCRRKRYADRIPETGEDVALIDHKRRGCERQEASENADAEMVWQG